MDQRTLDVRFVPIGDIDYPHSTTTATISWHREVVHATPSGTAVTAV